MGNPVAGSGSNRIGISTTYENVNAILASLQYTAGSATGSDTIRVDVWNQAGVDTTGSVPVTISDTGATTDRWIGSVSSDWNDGANWSTGAVPTTGDTVLIYGNTLHDLILSNATITGETIDLQGTGNSAPTVDFNDVTLDSLLQSGNAGQLHIGGTLTIGPNGTLLADPQATLSITGTAETIVNNGSIISGSGGELRIYNQATTGGGSATLINDGSMDAQGGRIELGSFYDPITNPPGWNVLNSGSVTVTQGADLALYGTLNGGTVAFSGSGSLTLEQTQALAGGASLSGFGQGDAIHLIGPAWGTLTALNNGTLQVGAGGGIEAIPLAGSYSLGSFEDQAVGGVGNPSIIGYAPDGGPSGLVNPDIIAPAGESVAQGATFALDNVSIQFASGVTSSNVTLGIDAGSGTLYMNGASGSGTSHLSLGVTPLSQVNADLGSLLYVPAYGSTADTVLFNVAPSGQSYTIRSIPIKISGTAASGPLLTEPASETVAAGGTVAVGGNYTDSFAAGNPGTMYLRVSDSIGTLRATDAAGNTVADPAATALRSPPTTTISTLRCTA